MQEVEPKIDGVHHEQLASAHPAHRGQRAHRVAQVEKQAAQIHEVELAVVVGLQRVDAALATHHSRAQGGPGQLEAVARRLAPAQGLDRGLFAAGRPVPVLRLEQVDRDHLGGPAALQLERPEAVERPHVQAAAAGPGRALSAWGAFGKLDAVLVAAGAAGLWAAAVRPARWLAALRALAGAGAVLLVAVKAASPPAIAGSPREGVAVALLGAGALAAGGLADLRRGRTPAPRAREAERAPGRPLDPAGGATIWQAGELRAARVESLR